MALLPFRREGHISLPDLQEEMNRLFDRMWHGSLSAGPFDGQEWAPPIDVLEEPDRFIIKAEVPGLEAGDVDVSISGETLTIKGQKTTERSETERHGYVRMERRFGSFSRSVDLPATVDPSNISATCRRGVLEIILPKKEEALPKSIRVEVQE